MNTDALIAAIDKEIERLQQARKLLAGADRNSDTATPKRGPGRPKGSGPKPSNAPAKTKRVLSEEARARIAAAQKKRWAAQKKAAKSI